MYTDYKFWKTFQTFLIDHTAIDSDLSDFDNDSVFSSLYTDDSIIRSISGTRNNCPKHSVGSQDLKIIQTADQTNNKPVNYCRKHLVDRQHCQIAQNPDQTKNKSRNYCRKHSVGSQNIKIVQTLDQTKRKPMNYCRKHSVGFQDAKIVQTPDQTNNKPRNYCRKNSVVSQEVKIVQTLDQTKNQKNKPRNYCRKHSVDRQDMQRVQIPDQTNNKPVNYCRKHSVCWQDGQSAQTPDQTINTPVNYCRKHSLGRKDDQRAQIPDQTNNKHTDDYSIISWDDLNKILSQDGSDLSELVSDDFSDLDDYFDEKITKSSDLPIQNSSKIPIIKESSVSVCSDYHIKKNPKSTGIFHIINEKKVPTYTIIRASQLFRRGRPSHDRRIPKPSDFSVRNSSRIPVTEESSVSDYSNSYDERIPMSSEFSVRNSSRIPIIEEFSDYSYSQDEVIPGSFSFSGPNSSRMPVMKESSVSDCSDSHEETNHENSSSGVDKGSKFSFWNAKSGGFSGRNPSRIPMIEESLFSDCSDSHEETKNENSSSGMDNGSKLSFWNAKSCDFSDRNSSRIPLIEESLFSDCSDEEKKHENSSRDRLEKSSKLSFRNPAVSVCSDSSQHIKLTLYLKLI